MITETKKRIVFADERAYIVTLRIDAERLATRMAIKARGNKRKGASMLQGAVTAQIQEDKTP